MTAAFAIYLLILTGTILLALFKGGSAERQGAVVLCIMALTQYPLSIILPPTYQTVDLASLVTDLIGVIGFGAIALTSKRFWPLWAASLQLLSCSAQFARAVQPQIEGLVYAVMKSAPSGIIIVMIATATISAMRRRKSANLASRQADLDPS